MIKTYTPVEFVAILSEDLDGELRTIRERRRFVSQFPPMPQERVAEEMGFAFRSYGTLLAEGLGGVARGEGLW